VATIAIEPEELISHAKAAPMLGVKPQTLASWRARKRGPAFVKIGRNVFYYRPDIAAYIAAARRDPAAA